MHMDFKVCIQGLSWDQSQKLHKRTLLDTSTYYCTTFIRPPWKQDQSSRGVFLLTSHALGIWVDPMVHQTIKTMPSYYKDPVALTKILKKLKVKHQRSAAYFLSVSFLSIPILTLVNTSVRIFTQTFYWGKVPTQLFQDLNRSLISSYKKTIE